MQGKKPVWEPPDLQPRPVMIIPCQSMSISAPLRPRRLRGESSASISGNCYYGILKHETRKRLHYLQTLVSTLRRGVAAGVLQRPGA